MSLLKYKKSNINDNIFSNDFEVKLENFFEKVKGSYLSSINDFKNKVNSSSDIVLQKIQEYLTQNKINNKVDGKHIKVSFSSKTNKYFIFAYLTYSFKYESTDLLNLKNYLESSLTKFLTLNNIRVYINKDEIYFVFKSEI